MLRIIVIALASVAFFWLVAVPIFERFATTRSVRAYQRLTMPLFRPFCGLVPGYGVIETVGRRTGRRRRVPVGGRLDGRTFWLVAGIGRRAGYVRNIEADPRVRVKVLGRWRTGTAHLCPDDDPRRRMLRISPVNGVFLWIAGGEPLSVRIDLDR